VLADVAAPCLYGPSASRVRVVAPGGRGILFEAKSFAVLFVVLLAVPALALPSGGAPHVF
jgi:hypothetical protein